MLEDTGGGMSDPAKPNALSFYKETRDHIKHEDNLTNQRMTWMIALQAFLFGAYGFSLSAQATGAAARTALINKNASGELATVIADQLKIIDQLDLFIVSARTGLAIMGILVALFVFLGLCAASMAIGTFVKKWHTDYKDCTSFYPPIVGNYEKRYIGHRYFGLIPSFAIPLSCIAVWSYLEHDQYFVTNTVVMIAALAMVIFIPIFILMIGIGIGRRETK